MVGFNQDFPTLDASRSEIAEAATQLRFQYGGRIRHVYDSVLQGFAAAELTGQQARTIAADHRVAFVEEDCILEPSSPQWNPPWHLDRIDQRYLPLDNKYGWGSRTGWNVHVYILDYLIRHTHEEFEGRVLSRTDCTFSGGDMSGASCTAVPGSQVPEHYHGTAVASVVGGATRGAAKNVKLHSVRVCQGTGAGACASSDVIAGVMWVANNHTTPAIANISLNYNASVHSTEDYNNALYGLRQVAIPSAIGAGVSVTLSAGNQGGSASLYPPAGASGAMTVAATNSSDTRPSWSNYGSSVDLFAPGQSIAVATHGSDSSFSLQPNHPSGTSFSAPLVAGVAALYLEANQTATPAIVKNWVLSWATSGVVSDTMGSPNLLLFSPFGN